MGSESDYAKVIREHYEVVWQNKGTLRKWSKGPVWGLPEGFGVLELPPTPKRPMWTYGTVCMSQPEDSSRVELHMFAKGREDGIVELLTATAHFHRTGHELNHGHTVNFGRPWLPKSVCDRGLVSLPYLDGPVLEYCDPPNGNPIRFLWLIPITQDELKYKKARGLAALEEALEKARFDYLDATRKSVV